MVHEQETATTCRERCGGQGYLSVNKFGAIIGFAHAGMTAEGDNRVLMQKVAKEYLTTLDQPQVRDRLRVGAHPPHLSGEPAGSLTLLVSHLLSAAFPACVVCNAHNVHAPRLVCA